MALVQKKILGSLLSILTASTLLAAEAKDTAKPAAKPTKKSKVEPPKEAEAPPPAATPIKKSARSTTAEGITLFEVAKPKNRPMVILSVKESEDFKGIPLIAGLKPVEVVTPKETPKKETPPSSAEPSASTDQKQGDTPGKEPEKPVAREKTADDIKVEKAENAAAEDAELPVNIGPVE